MANRRPITLLHLSDLQFGRNHAFGRQNLPPPDAKFDSLLEKLKDDLNGLRDDQDHKLIPDLVIVSGDLTEWGMPSEFEQVCLFLKGISNHLDIEREKFVVVPGNHDINRKACAAYFMSCSANEIEPDEPFWTKWQHYNEKLAQKFYEDTGIAFSVQEPWTWHVYTDLEVVVAGLNSTMSEIHDIDETDPLYEKFVKKGTYGHFGIIGAS
jgi:predicted MPP superfamily phosphohydrolase